MTRHLALAALLGLALSPALAACHNRFAQPDDTPIGITDFSMNPPASASSTGPTPSTPAASSAPSASSSARTNDPSQDASACASQPGADPACRWTIAKTRYCGGSPPPPTWKPEQVCVCNQCSADIDCSSQPDGKCKAIGALACEGLGQQRCTYPGEPCYDDSCSAGTKCLLDNQGLPACRRPEPPRP
jgi:hypothetical protein